MWSATVWEPALPLRSSPASASPPGDFRAVQEGQQRVGLLLPRRGGILFVAGMVDDQGGVDVDIQGSRKATPLAALLERLSKLCNSITM